MVVEVVVDEVVGGLLVCWLRYKWLWLMVHKLRGCRCSHEEGVCISEENNQLSIGNHQDSHGHDTMFEKI